jgi:hypothetical protein
MRHKQGGDWRTMNEERQERRWVWCQKMKTQMAGIHALTRGPMAWGTNGMGDQRHGRQTAWR